MQLALRGEACCRQNVDAVVPAVGIAAATKFENRVCLKAGAIVISAQPSSKRFGVGAQVSHAERFEENAEGGEVCHKLLGVCL